MDFNQHMRNAAYLGCAEETRMRYFESNGWTMNYFRELQFGPVVLEDKLTYRRELRLLEPFHVDITMAALTPDGRKMKVRNQFFRDEDGELCASVDSVCLWLDLKERKPRIPPPELAALLSQLDRTADFEPW
jgi:acyl-CoA thioester hydrolase